MCNVVKIDIDVKDRLMCDAARHGKLDSIKYLALSKSHENGVGNNQRKNIIEVACRYGRVEVVKFLVSQGADIGAIKDYAIIQRASRHGRLKIVKYLVSQGADIRANNNHAIQLASFCGFFGVVNFLVSQGGDKR
jgi:ankyrin repeat protein